MFHGENRFKVISMAVPHSDLTMAVPHSDLFWYCLNGMGAQKKNAPKKLIVTFFPYLFQIKTI